jgi:hypothetical protein
MTFVGNKISFQLTVATCTVLMYATRETYAVAYTSSHNFDIPLKSITNQRHDNGQMICIRCTINIERTSGPPGPQGPQGPQGERLDLLDKLDLKAILVLPDHKVYKELRENKDHQDQDNSHT